MNNKTFLWVTVIDCDVKRRCFWHVNRSYLVNWMTNNYVKWMVGGCNTQLTARTFHISRHSLKIITVSHLTFDNPLENCILFWSPTGVPRSALLKAAVSQIHPWASFILISQIMVGVWSSRSDNSVKVIH